MTRAMIKFIGASAALTMAATPVMAEKARDLVDINGMRGSSAESALQSRGFRHESTHKSSRGYVHSYWWDAADDDCVQVDVYDGRVERISDASDQDCGHHKGSGAAAAVGVAAGAALIGALLSHKSHHHDDNKHHGNVEDEAHYERGYTDGIHNAPYHNTDRSNAYSDGYSAGVDERQANLRHHHGRGGYARVARYDDLDGMRGPRARDILRERGFERVNRFGDDNTRYSIMWRAESRQCLQLTIADGRVYDIRDIGYHPDCR